MLRWSTHTTLTNPTTATASTTAIRCILRQGTRQAGDPYDFNMGRYARVLEVRVGILRFWSSLATCV
jgi:hypothetical protein